MKKLLFIFIFLLLAVLACNNKQNQSNQNNTTEITEVKGTQIPADSLKPPIIKQARTPIVFQIPTKPGKSYIKKYSNGEEIKIDLVPPEIKLLPVVVINLQSSIPSLQP